MRRDRLRAVFLCFDALGNPTIGFAENKTSGAIELCGQVSVGSDCSATLFAAIRRQSLACW
jgi:hypothetical protein